jgi:hypothetical protein
MILEPKHKNLKAHYKLKIQKIVISAAIFPYQAFKWYYFKVILDWWHSPFNIG